MLGAIAGDVLSDEFAVAVLSADCAAENILGTQRLNGMEDFCLLIPNCVGLKRDWRFHSREADELHDVVGHHVAQGTSRVVVAATLLDADGFRHGNLNVIDVAPVPDGFEDAVGEAERHDVLDGLFAQVVVDAVDL